MTLRVTDRVRASPFDLGGLSSRYIRFVIKLLFSMWLNLVTLASKWAVGVVALMSVRSWVVDCGGWVVVWCDGDMVVILVTALNLR